MKREIDKISVAIALEQYIERYRDVERFMGFCHQCNAYGKSWSCPPFEQSVNLLQYKYATIYATKIYIDPSERQEVMDSESLSSAMERILDPVRRSLDAEVLLLEQRHEGSRALFAGSCRSCAKGSCTRLLGAPCIKPHLMRPSLEALGFDVAATTSELLGIKLCWSRDTLPEYFTLVYALFSTEKVE